MLCSSRYFMTPLAASRPYALPPVSTTASTCSTRFSGCSSSVSRVAGAPPRTSTPPTATVSHRITVQPVAASRFVSCPTRMPGMSVMSSCMRVRSFWSFHFQFGIIKSHYAVSLSTVRHSLAHCRQRNRQPADLLLLELPMEQWPRECHHLLQYRSGVLADQSPDAAG